MLENGGRNRKHVGGNQCENFDGMFNRYIYIYIYINKLLNNACGNEDDKGDIYALYLPS